MLPFSFCLTLVCTLSLSRDGVLLVALTRGVTVLSETGKKCVLFCPVHKRVDTFCFGGPFFYHASVISSTPLLEFLDCWVLSDSLYPLLTSLSCWVRKYFLRTYTPLIQRLHAFVGVKLELSLSFVTSLNLGGVRCGKIVRDLLLCLLSCRVR